MTTVLIIVVLVVLRKSKAPFISRRRLFKYQLKTTDISDSLTRLHGLLERVRDCDSTTLACSTFQMAVMNFVLGWLSLEIITG
jgi:hypothetical protein